MDGLRVAPQSGLIAPGQHNILLSWPIQVRLYVRAYQQQVPGNKGLTTMPTAAVVMLLFGSAMQVHVEVEQTSVRQVLWMADAPRHGV
jgi:hypothetical protein